MKQTTKEVRFVLWLEHEDDADPAAVEKILALAAENIDVYTAILDSLRASIDEDQPTFERVKKFGHHRGLFLWSRDKLSGNPGASDAGSEEDHGSAGKDLLS